MRRSFDKLPAEAHRAGYAQVFENHRKLLMDQQAAKDDTVVSLPGLQKRVRVRDLTYRQILDVAHERATRAAQRALRDYQINGERNGKRRAGEAQ